MLTVYVQPANNKEKTEAKLMSYKTCIGISTQKDYIKLAEVCHDIAVKDDTFKYKIVKSLFPKYKFVLIIRSKTKDQAHKRGVWFRAKVDNSILYWVKPKE